jgi:hypothetical protein
MNPGAEYHLVGRGNCHLGGPHLRAMTIIFLGLSFGITLTSSAFAQADNGIHGRFLIEDFANFNRADSLDAALGSANYNNGLANLRLTWEPTFDQWSFDVHYVLSAESGEAVTLMNTKTALITLPPSTWFNLTNTFVNQDSLTAQQTIDRLAVGYSTPDFVIKIGRQALTWGSGFVFRPMDLFDPFSPVATDTEFKPGTDMIYTQYLFADGSDLQFIAVPRSRVLNGAPDANESSFALHYHGTVAGVETTALLARDHGDWTGALGVAGPLEGSTWNIEILPTAVRNGPTHVSALANISDAVTLFDRNTTIFAEYFRNGFGVTGDATFTTLPPDLLDRLARGQLFNVRTDYLAAGMTLEYSPLVTLSPTLIADLDDQSLYFLVAANWSLSNSVVLIAGAQAPLGPKGSEFGGLPLSPANPTALSPAAQLYLQLRCYF